VEVELAVGHNSVECIMLRKRRVGLPAPDRLIGGPTILRDQPEETRPQAKPSPLSWRSLARRPGVRLME
jgi:hypothetical protein